MIIHLENSDEPLEGKMDRDGWDDDAVRVGPGLLPGQVVNDIGPDFDNGLIPYPVELFRVMINDGYTGF